MPAHSERDRMREQILRDLLGLHADWQRIAQRLALKTRARFREAQFRLGSTAQRGRPGVRDLQKAAALLAAVRIKPDKARAKDLLRIETVLGELLEVLPARER